MVLYCYVVSLRDYDTPLQCLNFRKPTQSFLLLSITCECHPQSPDNLYYNPESSPFPQLANLIDSCLKSHFYRIPPLHSRGGLVLALCSMT